MAAPLSIGALAEQSGCNVPTIRYYEQIGLLPRALRTAGGHRHYRDSDLRRLQFIRRCRDFGFPIGQVREMVAMFEDGDGDCADVRDLAQTQLGAVRARLTELRELEASLAAFVDDCNRSCAGGARRDCCIIDSLSGCGAPGEAIDIAATEIRRRS
jgi:DNA-binding transcriptional MerR regulator